MEEEECGRGRVWKRKREGKSLRESKGMGKSVQVQRVTNL